MSVLNDIAVMVELEMRRLRHDKTEMYTRMVQPILWLIAFGPIMGSRVLTNGIPYTDFITPGILIQSAVFVSIFYGLNMVWERENGILKKLLVTPSSRYSIVIGRSMASGIRSTLQVIMIIPFAVLVGVKFVPNPLYFILALIIIFFASGGFAAISILVASFFKTRDRMLGVGQAIVFPLFFLSSALYPVDAMPPALKQIAAVNPMSYVVDAVRSLLITGDLSHLAADMGVIVLFDVIMFSVASVSFRKIIE